MCEELDYLWQRFLFDWYHFCRLLREGRGITKDRSGRRYWVLIREYRPNHFRITLLPWPGLRYTRRIAGWLSVGQEKNATSWMIYDVQVYRGYEHQGLGTRLMRTAIHLARRRGASQLRGVVTREDAQSRQFLPFWYARLGFIVEPMGISEAPFSMDLQSQQGRRLEVDP